MVWAKAALASGLILLITGFGVGAQPRSTHVDNQTFNCGAAIPTSWLVPGTPKQTLNSGPKAPVDERRAVVACGATINQFRAEVLSAMGLGALLVAFGWGAALELRRPETVRLNPPPT